MMKKNIQEKKEKHKRNIKSTSTSRNTREYNVESVEDGFEGPKSDSHVYLQSVGGKLFCLVIKHVGCGRIMKFKNIRRSQRKNIKKSRKSRGERRERREGGASGY